MGASPANADLFPGTVMVEVSVVVPTYRRPRMLTRCLGALLDQELQPGRFEIIVCDDGPDEATRACVQEFAARGALIDCVVRYLPVTATQGPAGARNCGWRAAQGAVIAFTDDDTIPDPRWLSEGLRAMTVGVGAVAGRIHVPLAAEPTDYELDAAGLAEAEFATANCFVRRALLLRTGGFDERYTSAWREDSDLHYSLLEAGAVVTHAKRAVVVHPVRPGKWGTSIAQQKKSQFDALLYKKHPLIFRSRISPAPWVYYVITAVAVVGLVSLAGGWLAVALPSFAVWGLLSGLFAAQRLAGTSRKPLHVIEMVATSFFIPLFSVFWRAYGGVRFRVAFW